MQRDDDAEATSTRAQRREELLDAAAAVIRRDGPGVSMVDIAAEAGITKPIIYSHFGDKSGLAAALGGRFSSELTARLASVDEHQPDTRAALAEAIDAWISFIEDEPELYRFLTRGTLGKADRFTEHGLVVQIGSALSRHIGALLRASGRDSGPAEPWAYGIVGTVHVATEWWLERRSMSRPDLVEYLTALIWGGLSAQHLITPES